MLKKLAIHSLPLILAVAVLAAFSAIVPHVAAGESRVDVLVTFGSAPGASEAALIERANGRVAHQFHLVPVIAANLPESALPGISRNPHVVSIEEDGRFYKSDAELDNTWGVKHIGAGAVHDAGSFGAAVKVAVIDTGVDYTHPELAAIFAGGYDFVNGDADPMDDDGHGTHVAGTIAAADNDAGVIGVAPAIELYALKVISSSGSGSFSDVIAAVEWAVDNGIQVTNNSYGSSMNPGGAVQAAFDAAEAAGVLHIAAAGNSGNCGGKGNSVGYPARYDSVVAVAATTKSDSRPCFSSTGDTVELSAPGVTINSAKLGGGYVEYSGTSMASPHVVGGAALVIAAGIVDTNGDGNINDEVRGALNGTAVDLGGAGRDPEYGYGLVDVAAAVASVSTSTSPSPPPPPPPPPPSSTAGTSTVSAITYTTEGGKNSDKHLNVTVSVVDNAGNPLGGAGVTITLNLGGSAYGSGTGTTGSDGMAVFTLKNAPSGCYDTVITDVAASGLTWDRVTPLNGLCK